MPGQRSAGAEERSQLVLDAGVPWWGATLIAITAALVGLGIEAGLGHQELGGVFATCYALGCIAAVLAVRQSGIFTAVIQPPLLLFAAVPLAYYLFHQSSFGGLKDILITCGYPLIERFPLMLFTSAAVLLIGLVRWYLAMSASARPQVTAQRPGLMAALSTKLASAFAGNGSVDEDPGTRPARPRHVVDRPGAARGRRPAGQAARPARSRNSVGESDERRRRRQPARRPVRDDEWDGEPRPGQSSREPRRTPPPPRRERRPDYHPDYPDQGPPRGSRMEPYESRRSYQSPPQYGAPYPPSEQHRRPERGNDHHPVSRVRYRDAGPSDSDANGRRRRRY